MADIVVNGVTYNGVKAVAMQNTSGRQVAFYDLTGDTVSAETLLSGYTAHDAAGNLIVGSAVMISLTEIVILSQPSKTTYAVGEFFDASGMVVQANYSNGASQTVSAYTYTPSDALSESDSAITVSYAEGGVMKTAIIPITVINGISIGSLAVGSIVKLSESGTLAEYLVVNQGIPSGSSLYDSSCNGTWLLRKDIYGMRQWHSSWSNSYKDSAIHEYLNGTFLGLFDSGSQERIVQVKIPYANGAGSSVVASGSSGLSAHIFLLSGYEVGWTTSTNKRFPVDGACLSYFSGTSAANSKRIAYLNGAARIWWLRSSDTNNTSAAWSVLTDGSCYLSVCDNSNGVRPAMVMYAKTLVTEDDDGSYVLAT